MPFMGFIDRLRFKDVLAVGTVGTILYGFLTGIPQSEIVIGAEITVVTLIVQHYFRKKDEVKA